MSNKLAKFLTICAIAVVLPLFIAGTVIAVYFSMNADVTFEIAYTNYTISEDDTVNEPVLASTTNNAKVVYDETADSYTLTYSHVKDANIHAEGEGFVFEGWFDGSREEYAQAVAALQDGESIQYLSGDNSMFIKTGDYDNLTAVFSIITYNVTFDASTALEGGSYVYGAELPTLSDTGTSAFVGWTISGSEDTTVYTNATFANDGENFNVTLVPEYKDFTEFTYTLYLNVGENYYTGDTTVEFTNANYTTTLANMFDADNWTHAVYANSWQLTGFSANSTTYTLSDQETFMEDALGQIDEVIQVTPIFECKYDTFTVNGVSFRTTVGEYIYTANDGTSRLIAVEGEYNVDMTSTLLGNAEGSDHSLFYYDMTDTYYDAEGNVVTPVRFRLDYNGAYSIEYAFSDFSDDTIYGLIEYLVTNNGEETGNGGTFNISNLVIFFE